MWIDSVHCSVGEFFSRVIERYLFQQSGLLVIAWLASHMCTSTLVSCSLAIRYVGIPDCYGCARALFRVFALALAGVQILFRKFRRVWGRASQVRFHALAHTIAIFGHHFKRSGTIRFVSAALFALTGFLIPSLGKSIYIGTRLCRAFTSASSLVQESLFASIVIGTLLVAFC
jgi:hypothetical protein